MTITVRMLQTRQGDAGAQLLVGQTYTLRDDLAAQLVGAGYAEGVDDALARRGTQPADWSDSTGTALVRPDGESLRMAGFRYTNARPYLCSFGDSINSQDVPADTLGSSSGVGPAR